MAYARIKWLSSGEINCHSIQLQINPFRAITVTVKEIDGRYDQIQFCLDCGLTAHYFRTDGNNKDEEWEEDGGLMSKSEIWYESNSFQWEANETSSRQAGENTKNDVKTKCFGLSKDTSTSKSFLISVEIRNIHLQLQISK